MNNKVLILSVLAAMGILLTEKVKANSVLATKLFNNYKGVKESEQKFQPILFDFWRAAGLNKTKANSFIAKNYAWSAAFISYVMTKSGFKNFPVSTSHTCFASKIKNGNFTEFTLHEINDYTPKVGDIVMLNRGGGSLTYDNFKCGDASHSDIVVYVDYKNHIIQTIGGNISNQISSKTVRLNNDNKLLSSLYFAIIEVK
jgi:hypothetical protein